jgi:Ethanolamine utilization protein
MGKPLTGEAEIDAAVVTKTTGNLIVLPKDHYLFRRAAMPIEKIRQQTKSACIQCRMCTDLCPRRLLGHQIRPNLMMRNLWREDQITDNEEYLRTFGDAANCCDCGVCEMFACPMGCGVMELKDGASFEWTLTYDEYDIVLDGHLEIEIDGRVVKGDVGDVIYIPKGSHIHFQTPDHARYVYTVYPANWQS